MRLIYFHLAISFPLMILLVLLFMSSAIAGKGVIFDKNNIPLVDYGIIEGIDIGLQYNPVNISQRTYEHYNEYIKYDNETAKEIFLNYVNWLANKSIKKDNYTFFPYNFPFPPYDLKVPWYSAMAQGEVVLPLLNAYKITQDEVYLTTAKNALNVLFIEINDPCKCGVTYKTLSAGWWYEEYANGHENGPKVLNGMMFTLMGIYHYYNFTQDHDALYLFNQGILSLKNNLHNYDKNNTYSSYDKYKGNAPIMYHKVHVCLLDKLYNITEDDLLKEYYDNWTNSYKIQLDLIQIDENCFF